MGLELYGMSKVLSRIDDIVEKCSVRTPAVQPQPSSRFTDVLDDLRKVTKKRAEQEPDSIQMTIDRCADTYNIDEELIRAIIQVESGWKSDAVSYKGAQGLMQLMPKTGAMLGVDDPFDPEQNIEGGVKYIASLTDKYKGDIEKALAAYNAGPGRVDSGSIPQVTERYVNNVMALYHRYREGK